MTASIKLVVLALIGLLCSGTIAARADGSIGGFTGGPVFDPAGGERFVPIWLAGDGRGRVFALSDDMARVVVYSLEGQVVGDWATGLTSAVVGPGRIAASRAGDVYILTHRDEQLRRFTPEGRFVETLGDPGDDGETRLEGATELTVAPTGELVLVGGLGEFRLDPSGRLLQRRPAEFAFSLGVGPDGLRWANSTSFGVVKRSDGGQLLALIGVGGRTAPFGGRGLAPGGVERPGRVAVTDENELVTLDSSALQVFASDGRLRRHCPLSLAAPELTLGSDGSVIVSDDGVIRSYKRSAKPGLCSQASFAIRRFSLEQSRSGRNMVRAKVQLKARGRASARRRYRLSVEVFKQRRQSCNTGEPEPDGGCVGFDAFATVKLAAARGGKAVRRTFEALGPGRLRVVLTATDSTSGERQTSRAVSVTTR